MNDTREAYSRLYQTDLVTAMEGEWKVGGDFKRIVCALAKKHPANIQVRLRCTPRTHSTGALHGRSSYTGLG